MTRFACIYIGPNRIEMTSSQMSGSHKIKTIDHAFYPMEIGYEIYNSGFISAHSGDVMERVLEEYITLARESAPEVVRVIISNEIALANNFIFFYHRLKMTAVGCELQVLSDEEELEMFCACIRLRIEEGDGSSFDSNAMLAAINGERIDFALTTNGVIDYTEQIPYGYFKLAEIVETITSQRTRYSKLLSEIIENKLRLATEHIGKRKLKVVALNTKDAQALAENFDHTQRGETFVFSQETINEAYRSLKDLTPEQIENLYPNIPSEQTLTIQATITVARQLIRAAGTNEILIVPRMVPQTITELQLRLTKRKDIRKWFEKGAYQSAIELANRYNVDQTHVDNVEYYSVRIYETLKKRYDMENTDKQLVRLAARLMDVGQYGGEEGQAQAVEEIILRENIIGLSYEQKRLIARICRNIKTNSYERTSMARNDFNMEDALVIAEITAIIKLAATLDQSRRSKISKLQCSLSEDELTLKITTSHNTQLENYYFNRDSVWMERIFELKPVLKVKRVKV